MDVYWLEQVEAQVPERDNWLSRSEADLLSRMKFAKRRADWRLGRWTAKSAVALCVGASFEMQELHNIEIRASLSGAPEVFFDGEPAGISISLSHRKGLGACAVTRSPMPLGCDVEFIEPHGEAFVADYFSVEEQAIIAEAPSADSDMLVALVWSAKESALKALREGLRLGTRSAIVSFDDLRSSHTEGWSALQVRCTNGQVFPGWWNQSGGYVRTILAASLSQPPILLLQSRIPKFKCTSLRPTLPG
jgi:4'-phosphopantetheinyl transferase